MRPIEQLGKTAGALGCSVLYDEPMSRHTTFRIGGPADLFVTVRGQRALQELVRQANSLEVPYLVMGNGSNMLVCDEGIRGMVVALGGEFRRIRLCRNHVVRCGSGATLSSLCRFALDHSLTGAEFLWGIPGTAGGAAFMNAGAYGGEMKDILLSCCHLTRQGQFGTCVKKDMAFSYRHSIYSDNRAAIVFLDLQLCPGDAEKISARMDDLLGRRKSKQPLDMPSAGSVFKRPEGCFAGTLIEQCGLKGKGIGGALVSPKHAGFIVNNGGATCRDVLNLIAYVQKTVLQKTGIKLECEVRMIE